MNNFKISQIQFQAKDTPLENALLLEKLFQKTLRFKPDLILQEENGEVQAAADITAHTSIPTS